MIQRQARNMGDCVPDLGATVAGGYVRSEAQGGRVSVAPMAAVSRPVSARGRVYVTPEHYLVPNSDACEKRLESLAVAPPDEVIRPTGNAGQATGKTFLYGLTYFRDLFTPRQLLAMCTFAAGVRTGRLQDQRFVRVARSQA